MEPPPSQPVPIVVAKGIVVLLVVVVVVAAESVVVVDVVDPTRLVPRAIASRHLPKEVVVPVRHGATKDLVVVIAAAAAAAAGGGGARKGIAKFVPPRPSTPTSLVLRLFVVAGYCYCGEWCCHSFRGAKRVLFPCWRMTMTFL